MSPRGPRSSSGGQARGRRRLARLIGAIGMLILTLLLFWLLTDDSFRVTANDVTVDGVVYADEDAVREQLSGISRAPNVFRIRASDLVRDMHALPQVRSATAVVTVPANVSVRVNERRPLFMWSDGAQPWLVDAEGVLFARAEPPSEVEGSSVGSAEATASIEPAESSEPAETSGPAEAEDGSPTTSADAADAADGIAGTDAVGASRLPIVEDHRLVSEPPSIGSLLPSIDLAVMSQLLAVTPELLGSESGELELSIDELDGYVLRSDLGWQAVFGHYSPTLQPPDAVPRQVQCLGSLLASRERRLERVRLAVSADGCGTFTRFGDRT